MNHKLGLLSPEGRFYPAEYEEHQSTGDCLFRELFTGEYDAIFERGSYVDGLLELRRRGWLSIHSGGTVRRIGSTLTQPQIDFLFDLAMAYQAEWGEGNYATTELMQAIEAANKLGVVA